MVRTLFAKNGQKAKVQTETPEEREARQKRAEEQANRVFRLTPEQKRVVKKASGAR